MTRQGIVLQIAKNSIVVMTKDGEFLEMPLSSPVPALGAKVALPSPSSIRRPYRLALVAALLVFVLSLSLFRPLLMPQAVAAVAFDLPVGLELGVDAENRVVNVKAKDPASQALAKALNLKGEDIYSAANQVVQAACRGMESGTRERDPAFMVTVMSLKGKGKMSLDRQLLHQQIHQELQRHEYEGYLIVQGSEGDLRKKAAELDLPVSKYLLWERNRAAAIDFNNIEELKNLPLEALVPENDEEILERRFPGMWCRVGKSGDTTTSPMHHHQLRGSEPLSSEVPNEEIPAGKNEEVRPHRGPMQSPMRERGNSSSRPNGC